MSLKAKIEAVIYASEEPVTLAQLAGLLGHEAQSELDRTAGAQADLPLSAEGVEEPKPEEAHSPAPEPTQPDESAIEGPPKASLADESADDGQSSAEQSAAQQSAADKRQARERERRVREFLRDRVDELISDYATSARGLEVREVAGGYRLGTKPEYHDAVRGFVRSLKPPLKLTLQALETLAVVAYKQPVTSPEVSEIRGVDSGGVLGSLMARKLVTTAGRKQVVGRPILYKTTKDFLLRFGLKDIHELPSIEEFEKMAGELAEQEEMAMPEQHESARELAEERITHENLEEEKDASAPQADGDSSSLERDTSNLPANSLPAVDGRLSALPPDYTDDDPSAEEAAVAEAAEEAADAEVQIGGPTQERV